MSRTKGPPRTITKGARLCGCTEDELGDFDLPSLTYTRRIASLDLNATNFFETLHGGIIGVLADDSCGMAIYFLHGVNSATTKMYQVEFFGFTYPKTSLLITCKIVEETDEKKRGDEISMTFQVETQDELIAKGEATWLMR